jgi:hypothetical protein
VWNEAGEGEGQRALARAGRPDNEEAGTGREVERQVPDRVSFGTGIAKAGALGPDGGRAAIRGELVDQAGNPSSTPVWRSAATIPMATSGRTISPEIPMNSAIAASAVGS